MKRAFAVALLLWVAWPAGSGEKLHGKITSSDGTTTKITFTVQPRQTVIEVSGAPGAAVGDFVDFTVGKGNKIELNGQKLQITAIHWTP